MLLQKDKFVVIIMNKMKNEKKLVVLTSFLFLSVFLLGITSAADLCWIETSASTCESTSGNNVVMYVSDSTNAHGELESRSSHNYKKVLCCNFGGGSTSCSGNNKIIGLSSSTNAHAERPENSRYNSNVCYDSLSSCFSTTSNCASGELEVLRLSSSTNAHISGPGQSYNTKICCTVSEPLMEPPPTLRECEDGIDNDGDGLVDYPSDPGCTSASDNDEADTAPPPPNAFAFWANNNFVEITFKNVIPDVTNVKLVLENSGLSQGTNLDFDIREREFGPDTRIRIISGTTNNNERVVATWTITQEDLDTATDLEEFYFRVNGEQSGSLTLNILPPVDCGTVVICSDYEQSDCENDYCQVAEISVPGGVDCSDTNTDCFCTQNGNACGGAFSASTTTPPTTTPPAEEGDGIISIGETCDGSEWGGITGCSDFGEFTGGVLSCESPGRFNTFQCIGIEVTREIGTCLITEGDVDENGCDDGFLTISWTGQWIWNEEENPGHEDPEGLSLLCGEGGTRVIECPTQIKLPFFGLYNIIATIFLITIIYFILIRKNNKNH